MEKISCQEKYRGKEIPEILDSLEKNSEKVKEIRDFYNKKILSLTENKKFLGGTTMSINVAKFCSEKAREGNFVGGITPYVKKSDGSVIFPFIFATHEQKEGIDYVDEKRWIFLKSNLFDLTTEIGRSFKAALDEAFAEFPAIKEKIEANKSEREKKKEREAALAKELKDHDIQENCDILDVYFKHYKDAEMPKFFEKRFTKAKTTLFKLDKEKYYQYFPSEKPVEV